MLAFLELNVHSSAMNASSLRAWLIATLFFAGQSFGFDAILTDDSGVALSGRSAKSGALPTLVVDAKHNALLKFDLSTLPPGKNLFECGQCDVDGLP